MKLCVALDLNSLDKCLNLVKNLKNLDIWLKVGLRSYLRDGFKIIDEIHKIEKFNIFLDLKICDIPNTMADACEVIARNDVAMINLHASSGRAAMSAVMNRLNKLKKRPIVLAVSALTSFDEFGFSEIYNTNIKSCVTKFSKIAYECGLDGMVCSAFESIDIKKNTSDKFITLAPGIRPFGEDLNDQKRVANLELAKESKADFIVIGRPIYESKNPREIVGKILSTIV